MTKKEEKFKRLEITIIALVFTLMIYFTSLEFSRYMPIIDNYFTDKIEVIAFSLMISLAEVSILTIFSLLLMLITTRVLIYYYKNKFKGKN